jgi:small subunit ribosomal protein S9
MPRKKKETSEEKKKPTSVASPASKESTSVGQRGPALTKRDKPDKKTKETKAKKPTTTETLMGTGRRKTAVARVWLKDTKGTLLVNDRPIDDYFRSEAEKKIYEEPLRVVNRLGQFSGTIKLNGGGVSAQLGAVVHGLARALASYDPVFRETLSKKKLLTRDSRMKERRKYGHAGKARKKKQSPKR